MLAEFNAVRTQHVDGAHSLHEKDKWLGPIRRRLEEGFTVEQLKAAARGMFADEFHAARRYKHATPELCYRNEANVERFMREPEKPAWRNPYHAGPFVSNMGGVPEPSQEEGADGGR